MILIDTNILLRASDYVNRILTFNDIDFRRFPGIQTITPSSIAIPTP